MKTILPIFTLILLFSCQQEMAEDENKAPEVETTNSIEIFSEPTSEKKYETIEEYCEIKNRKELYDIFGENNIVDDVVWYAEGTVKIDCSILTNPINSDQVKFIWSQKNKEGKLDLTSLEIPYTIYDENYNPIRKQTVHSENGLYTGMILSDIEEWNEAPFSFYGFDWDFGGMTTPEDGSKLSKSTVDVLLGLEWPEEESAIDSLIGSIIGDVELNSNDEAVQNTKIYIEYLTYYIK